MARMESQPRQLVDAWMRAFIAADLDAILELHAPGATFTGTSSATFTDAPADIRAYFHRVLRERQPERAEVIDCRVQDFGELAVVTVSDFIAWRDTASPRESRGRASFVLRRAAEGWRIVSFHRSEVPVQQPGRA